ncbi:unnamed protein product [Pedinophyceae sp. YPF-701]|nr:unnamed protein product [Pedinophyceae sp. YPF-701]
MRTAPEALAGVARALFPDSAGLDDIPLSKCTRAVELLASELLSASAKLTGTHQSVGSLLRSIEEKMADVAEVSPFLRDSGAEPPGCADSRAPEGAASQRDAEANAMDFSRYRTRMVALEIAYVGWDYHGYASQATVPNTVEGRLFEAMCRTKLIPPGLDPHASLNYSRCGRTDIGVSAASQIVAIRLRSKAPALPAPDATMADPAQPHPTAGGHRGDPPPLPPAEEIDYTAVLNRALPADIQILGWADVPADFSARFNCTAREYRYYLPPPADGASRDLAAMRTAAAALQGAHDFRNFCKKDPNAASYERTIMASRVEEARDAGAGAAMFHVRGSAFLYHQVRCMVAVLGLVGARLEEPEVVKSLLDIEYISAKPQYAMAREDHLLLSACDYAAAPTVPGQVSAGFELSFHRSSKELSATAGRFRAIAEGLAGRLMLLRGLVEIVEARADGVEDPGGESGKRGAQHIPLLSRAREPPVRIAPKAPAHR